MRATVSVIVLALRSWLVARMSAGKKRAGGTVSAPATLLLCVLTSGLYAPSRPSRFGVVAVLQIEAGASPREKLPPRGGHAISLRPSPAAAPAAGRPPLPPPPGPRPPPRPPPGG